VVWCGVVFVGVVLVVVFVWVLLCVVVCGWWVGCFCLWGHGGGSPTMFLAYTLLVP